MIEINGRRTESIPAAPGFTANALQQGVFETMRKSTHTYRYQNAEHLIMELRLRDSIVRAARDLSKRGFSFRVFRDSFANPAFWDRTPDGGFKLKEGVAPADAVRDIYRNGRQYATECATAMFVVWYKAVLDVLPDAQFNKLFSGIFLMNWQRIDRDLALIEYDKAADILPGDALYFINPDVDPDTPEWQGENVFYLGGGQYYGHGIGIADAQTLIRLLNERRKEGATQSARLLESVKRQNYATIAKHAAG